MTTIALFQRRIGILKIIPYKKFNTISISLDKKMNKIFYIANINISNNSKYHLKELKNLKLNIKDTYYFKCNEIHKYLFCLQFILCIYKLG